MMKTKQKGAIVNEQKVSTEELIPPSGTTGALSGQQVMTEQGVSQVLLNCLRPKCGHTWIPDDASVRPKACPKCKSYYWDRPLAKEE